MWTGKKTCKRPPTRRGDMVYLGEFSFGGYYNFGASLHPFWKTQHKKWGGGNARKRAQMVERVGRGCRWQNHKHWGKVQHKLESQKRWKGQGLKIPSELGFGRARYGGGYHQSRYDVDVRLGREKKRSGNCKKVGRVTTGQSGRS